MKHIFFIILLSGCGEEIINQPEEPIQISPECLSCGYTTDNDYTIPEPKDSVQVVPNELSFYSIYNESVISSTGTIKILNHTGQEVVILDAFISDDADSSIGGIGGAQYFSLVGDYDDKIIQSGNSLSIEIEFVGSLYERAAILYVRTSFNNLLSSAKLHGKIFIW